jgi:hypothetical protein
VTSDSEESRPVVRIYCRACGNTTAKNAVTGREVPYRLRLPKQVLAELREDLPRMQCAVCAGPMAVEVLGEID